MGGAGDRKRLLYEVSIIRPLVILLLVVMHSFTMYAGNWSLPDGIENVPAYFWGVKLITGFRIEMIALIAGYVFAYQSVELHRRYDFKSFMNKKFKRLVVPGIIFSFVYYFCFHFPKPDIGSLRWFIRLSSGFGHLWFLPMLFWCFLLIWTIDRYRLSSPFLFVTLALCSVFRLPDLPLGFSRVFHFAFYCYLGYILYTNKNKILEKYMHGGYIVLLWLLYITLVCVSVALSRFDTGNLLNGVLNLFVACSGIMALYLLVCKCIDRPNFVIKGWVVRASSLCYGVYIYHQFFLMYLYYGSSLPQIAGTYLLPWIGMATSLCLSLLLTKLSLKTKVGRFLIG